MPGFSLTTLSRKFRNDKRYKLNSSTNIIWMIRLWRKTWGGHVARMCEMGNSSNILILSPEWKKPLGWLTYTWKYANKKNLKDIRLNFNKWTRWRFLRNFLTGSGSRSFWSGTLLVCRCDLDVLVRNWSQTVGKLK